jgi:hypothetical protein
MIVYSELLIGNDVRLKNIQSLVDISVEVGMAGNTEAQEHAPLWKLSRAMFQIYDRLEGLNVAWSSSHAANLSTASVGSVM